MSERMIERKRQQMGLNPLPPQNSYPNQAHGRPASGVIPAVGGMPPITNHLAPPYARTQVPVYPSSHAQSSSALAIVTSQDQKLESFLNLLTYSSMPPNINSIAAPSTVTSNMTQTKAQHNQAMDGQSNSTNTNIDITDLEPPCLPAPSPPTVPTSLTRRILQTQGCSYLDPNIAAIMSHAADHFLATVLSQALACRDLRIQGEDLRKQAHQREKLDRKKRKKEAMERLEKKRSIQNKKEDQWKNEIEKARKFKEMEEKRIADLNNPRENGSSGSGMGKGRGNSNSKKKSGGSSKKKNQSKLQSVNNSNNADDNEGADNGEGKSDTENDDLSENSLDKGELDEDLFYYNTDDDISLDDDNDDGDDEEDENRDMLLLRDIERPVQAWGMTFAGKLGLCVNNFDDDSDYGDESLNKVETGKDGEKPLHANTGQNTPGEVKDPSLSKKSSTSNASETSISSGKSKSDGNGKKVMDATSPKSVSSSSHTKKNN